MLFQPGLAGPYEDAVQYNLGALYENGYCVRRDSAEAEKWHRLFAGQGLPMPNLRPASVMRRVRLATEHNGE